MSNKSYRNVFACFVLVVLVLGFVGSVSAVKASIGNGKMILRNEVGDTIERSIRVINDNPISVDIEVTGSGDLEEDIEIIDEKFTLGPGEEKNANFKIDIDKPGDFSNRINIKFIPVDGGNGAGISAIVRVIVEGEDDGGLFDWFGSGEDEGEDEVSGEVTFGKKKNDDVSADVQVKDERDGNALMVLGGTFSIILFVALLILLVVASKHIKKNKDKDSRDEKDDGNEKGDKDDRDEENKSKKSSEE